MAEPFRPSDSMFVHNDMHIPDWRIELFVWDKELKEERFLVDCSNIMISDIQLSRQLNKYDSLSFSVEYLQFSKKLKEENSQIDYILMPWNTIVKVKRNFVTVFSGPMIHMNLALSANNKQSLNIQAMGYGYILTKRLVNCPLYGSYASICNQLIYEGQHEINWFSNYSFEYEDDESYFQDWEWSHRRHWRVTSGYDTTEEGVECRGYVVGDILTYSGDGGTCSFKVTEVEGDGKILDIEFVSSTVFTSNPERREKVAASGGSGTGAYLSLTTETELAPPRSSVRYHEGGIVLLANEYMFTKVHPEFPIVKNSYNIPQLTFKCVHKNSSNSTLTVALLDENEQQLYSTTITLSSANDWTLQSFTLPAKTGISSSVRYVKLTTNSNIEITDLQIYTKPETGDSYDYFLTTNFEDNSSWDKDRVRHYHYENIADEMESLTELENDNFEFWWDTERNIDIKDYVGDLINDIGITYPGDVQEIELEREIENIFNINIAQADQSITFKDANGDEQSGTYRWVGTYGSYDSINEYGVFHEQKAYDGVDRQEDLDEKAKGDLKIYSYVDDLPEITTDANIYSIDKIDIGKVLTLKVLSDKIFEYVNGEYRVYSWNMNVSTDSVENFSFKLIPIDKRHLQVINFPKMIKTMNNNIRRALIK